jgi:hypothetical protein
MNSFPALLRSFLAGCFLLTHARAAQTSEVFTDADGDTYQVVLTGPGTFALDHGCGDGPIVSITLADTGPGSTLSVKVTAGASGDANVSIGAVTGAGALKALKAAASHLDGAGVSLAQGMGLISVADVAAGVVLNSGTNKKLPKLAISARQIGTGVVVAAPGQTVSLTANAVNGLALTAKNVGALKVLAGGFAGDVRVANRLVSLSIKGGDFTGQINAGSIGTIRVAKDAALVGGSIVNSTIAAATKIGSVSLDGDLVNSKILAGAKLGADGLLGGSDENSDLFDRGAISSAKVGGAITNSIVGAGLTPLDGIFGNGNNGNNGNDGNKASRLGRLTSGSLSGDSIIGGAVFGPVKIANVKVNPKLDARFVLRRLLEGKAAPSAMLVAKAIDFLFCRKLPVQTGMKKGTIKPMLAAVVRGTVSNRAGGRLDGVTITDTTNS